MGVIAFCSHASGTLGAASHATSESDGDLRRTSGALVGSMWMSTSRTAGRALRILSFTRWASRAAATVISGERACMSASNFPSHAANQNLSTLVTPGTDSAKRRISRGDGGIRGGVHQVEQRGTQEAPSVPADDPGRKDRRNIIGGGPGGPPNQAMVIPMAAAKDVMASLR